MEINHQYLSSAQGPNFWPIFPPLLGHNLNIGQNIPFVPQNPNSIRNKPTKYSIASIRQPQNSWTFFWDHTLSKEPYKNPFRIVEACFDRGSVFLFVEPIIKVKSFIYHSIPINFISYFSWDPYMIWDPRKMFIRLENRSWCRGHFWFDLIIRVYKNIVQLLLHVQILVWYFSQVPHIL